MAPKKSEATLLAWYIFLLRHFEGFIVPPNIWNIPGGSIFLSVTIEGTLRFLPLQRMIL